jgi:hypothetical protein
MSDKNPFEGNGDDPFGAAPESGVYPKQADLRGRLLLITPTKFEANVPSSNPKYPPTDRVTADVAVLDGAVEGFDDVTFTDMWLSGTKVTGSLHKSMKAGQKMILCRIISQDNDARPSAENPWSVTTEYTEDDAVKAREYLANRKPVDPFSS